MSVVPFSSSAVDEALERRVFNSPEVHRFEVVHRTVAEFMAAEDLVRRIRVGLPVSRVLALICGIDGKPVASLRGLFAWLMAHDSTLAELYADRDPYAVATYGDSEVLSASAQRAVLVGLSSMSDPWFLTNENDRSSFRGLASLRNKDVILSVLQDPDAGVHAKVTMLEAIANSLASISDFEAPTRVLIADKGQTSWLRDAAVRAYAQTIEQNTAKARTT